MNNEILILVDYKGEFYCPHKGTSRTTDLDKTAILFQEAGYVQKVRHFEEIDFRNTDYGGLPVLYQSSQDWGLRYKGYIEDILLGLHLAGALLIPDFFKFRAHHNKVFQEVLRELGEFGSAAKRLRSSSFGTFEAFEKSADAVPYPAVVKPSAGDSGDNVYLVSNKKDALKAAKALSDNWTLRESLNNVWHRITRPGYVAQSTNRRKFIVQEYIPGLDHDYKILAFDGHYFAERRGVRPGDFRASGSKVPRIWPKDFPAVVLDFAHDLFLKCGVPYASIDVLFDGKEPYLGEIQFLRFGTKPLVEAPHYFEKQSDGWKRVDGAFGWEEELTRAVIAYLERTKGI